MGEWSDVMYAAAAAAPAMVLHQFLTAYCRANAFSRRFFNRGCPAARVHWLVALPTFPGSVPFSANRRQHEGPVHGRDQAAGAAN